MTSCRLQLLITGFERLPPFILQITCHPRIGRQRPNHEAGDLYDFGGIYFWGDMLESVLCVNIVMFVEQHQYTSIVACSSCFGVKPHLPYPNSTIYRVWLLETDTSPC